MVTNPAVSNCQPLGIRCRQSTENRELPVRQPKHDPFARLGCDASERRDVDLVRHDHQNAGPRPVAEHALRLRRLTVLALAIAEEGIECRLKVDLAGKCQLRCVTRPAPLR